VGGVDTHEVLVPQHDIVEALELCARERQGVLDAEEVRPPDRPDEERATRQEEPRLVGAGRIGDGVGDVLGRVPGRLEGDDPQVPDEELLTIGQRPVLESQLGPTTDDVLRADRRGKLPAARHVVVVEVRLEDMRDPDALRTGRRDIDIDIAAWIDDGRESPALIGDEGREVTKARQGELADEHRGSVPPDGTGLARC